MKFATCPFCGDLIPHTRRYHCGERVYPTVQEMRTVAGGTETRPGRLPR